MGTDPAQLFSGIAALSADVANPDPTFTTLTVSGASSFGDATISGDSFLDDLHVGGDATLCGSASLNDLFAGGDSTLSGRVMMDAIPTADPVVDGELWNDSNSAAISAGP